MHKPLVFLSNPPLHCLATESSTGRLHGDIAGAACAARNGDLRAARRTRAGVPGSRRRRARGLPETRCTAACSAWRGRRAPPPLPTVTKYSPYRPAVCVGGRNGPRGVPAATPFHPAPIQSATRYTVCVVLRRGSEPLRAAANGNRFFVFVFWRARNPCYPCTSRLAAARTCARHTLSLSHTHTRTHTHTHTMRTPRPVVSTTTAESACHLVHRWARRMQAWHGARCMGVFGCCASTACVN